MNTLAAFILDRLTRLRHGVTLATTAPADAVRLLADLDEDTADALTQVTP